jgi:glycosidase
MKKNSLLRILINFIGLLALLFSSFGGVAAAPSRRALASPNPSSVTIAGSLQSELGCPGDWQADCATTHLAYDLNDDVWQATFSVPAGSWEYKAALDDSWTENYGLNAVPNGANIPLNLASPASVKFYYDHKTHWVTDNIGSRIVTAPGSYQSELGCSGDWDPGCLRSWLEDPDGDGIYTLVTTALPAGSYEVKAAIDESWNENYGAGGVPNGPNIPFTVPADGAKVTFRFDSAANLLTVSAGHQPDNNVEYFGLGHNSQDSLYRAPFGAVTPGTDLLLRFRTYHNDVTGVRVRFYDTATQSEFFQDMQVAASNVSCYDPAQPAETCDFWQTSYTPSQIDLLYYRFIVQDGSATAYYADDNYFDGGWGTATPNPVDNSYSVVVYDPNFQPITWLQNSVIYQIFPDRFRNGRSSNDPSPSEPRYGYPPNPQDQILLKNWGDLPEGYCRSYVNPAQPCTEGPLGRDYFGGDLRGVQQRLNYLKALGVTAIYFNPIFESASNHGYDTQDYFQVDHFFGSNKEFNELLKQANQYGIRIILDGVFNHVSSDSPYFDRYHHFAALGACESPSSPYRDWFTFHDVAAGSGACAGSDGTPDAATYDGWFGFDSLPVLNKNNQQVRDLFYATDNSVARYWLNQGAAGWRLDVMGDPSFPRDFWTEFRQAVKSTNSQAPIIGELWKKNEVQNMAQGDTADTAMNYRFRNAILGFFGKVDNKGFPDDGQADEPPSLFAKKMTSIREDYPDAVYYNLMNLMDSHDTQRILWSLTPGQDNPQDKELNPANLAQGKALLKLATVVQMTVPGAPTIYYGDEVGVTGADDPDDRRTFPWTDVGQYGSGGDQDLLAHYQQLVALRAGNPVFRNGELSFLLTDDAQRSLAYLLRSSTQAAIVAINRSDQPQTLSFSLQNRLPDDVQLVDALNGSGSVSASAGVLTFDLAPFSAAVWLPAAGQDLTAPPAPDGLAAVEGSLQVDLSWNPVAGAAAYRIYRSPVRGGGYVQVGETSATSFTDSGLVNGQTVYYVVRALDSAGNLGPASAEASALPHYTIGWANLQWPPSIQHTISAINRTPNIYGQVWIDGATSQPGPTPSLVAELGYGPQGSDPATDPNWIWIGTSFNVDAGNNDEFVASLLPEEVGQFDYAYRYTTTGGRDWLYADLDGTGNGYDPAQAGQLTVNTSGDTTPPAAPANLIVLAQSPAGVDLAWDAVSGDPSLYGYEVLRGSAAGGPYTQIARLTTNQYSDTSVTQNATYYYVVRAVDTSFNRSGYSNEVSATAQLRTVSVTFTVTVPSSTDGTGRSVYIAGTLDRLDGNLPQWDPGGVVMTRLDSTHWTITLTGKETTALEYKYVLGDWNYVEKDAACQEINNRTLTLDYGSSGVQIVNDTVPNWRNVSPCGP